jgi:purine catabolism regulator
LRGAKLALANHNGIVGAIGKMILGLLDARRMGDAQQFADSLLQGVTSVVTRHEITIQFRVAVGPTVVGLEAASTSLREAQSTVLLCEELQVTSNAVTSRGMAADRVLGRLLDDPVLAAVIDDQLQPLLRYDAQHGTQLSQTLWAYLVNGSAKSRAADSLYIRRQSLYKRLSKITELIGDVDNPQRRLPLLIALRAHELLAART